MSNTHFYMVASDVHLRGAQNQWLLTVDPLLGQVLSVLSAPSPAPTINTVARGATSHCRGRITRIISPTIFVLESWTNPDLLGQAGGAFAVSNGLLGGETVNFDNGGSALVLPVASGQSYPLLSQAIPEHCDQKLNEFVPADLSDTPYWNPYAKFSRQIILTGASVSGDTQWIQGARIVNSTTGATATILFANAVGPDYAIQIIRATGTWAAGNALAVTTTATGGVGSDTAVIGSVGDDPPQGAWLPSHPMPNMNGSGLLWEYPPHAQLPDFGPCIPLVRLAYEKHVTADDVDDRGARVIPFSCTDREASPDAFGGVTVQVVKCTGTFSTAWIAGETVTGSGGWSATVHGFNAIAKYLFVVRTNGSTLTAGTVTGGTSAATATATGAAVGWQKGSTHWNAMVAEATTALAATGALYASAAARWDGVLLFPWNTEIETFSTAVGAAWPSLTVAQDAWQQIATDLRTYFGNEDMPIAIGQPDSRLRSDVTSGGFNYSYYLNLQIGSLKGLIENFAVVKADGFEFLHDPTLGAGTPLSKTYHRPQDYQTFGERGWRGINLYNTEIPQGNWELFPIIVVAGQSQQVGSIPSATLISLDKDPNLYPSDQFGNLTGFPGVVNVDPNVLSFNTTDREWQPYAIDVNDNTFFGMSSATCGPTVTLMARHKKRWSKVVGETGRVGLIKLAVNASSAYAGAVTAPATWDPSITTSPQTTASMTVTAIPGTLISPPLGRFTAAAGTFSSGWVVGMSSFVSGSGLGLQGYGGNNTATYGVNVVATVAGDGSYVEFFGSFVAEGPLSFTLTAGPHALMPLAEQAIRDAFEDAARLRLIPFPALLVWENGEADIGFPDEYEAALLRVLNHLETVLGGRPKGHTAIAKVLLQLNENTPMPFSDAIVEEMRAIQVRVASALENAATGDPSDPTLFPLETSGQWPITSRLQNGVHRTPRGHLMAGYLADQISGTLEGIPEHPEGEASIVFGGGDGGTGTDTVGTDTVGEDVVDIPIVVEDGTGLPNADSYITVEEFRDMATTIGGVPEITAATDAQVQVWLRKSARHGIDMIFGGAWGGYRRTENQALAWPRIGAHDCRTRYALLEYVIPEDIKWCQFWNGLGLATEIDPLKTVDPSSDATRKLFATSTTDTLPGISRSRSYSDGGSNSAPPRYPILHRMNAAAAPFFADGDDFAGVA